MNSSFNPRLPFFHDKVPVAHGVRQLADFIDKHVDFFIVPYLAHKESQDWERSISRIYFNRAIEGMIYVPVDIAVGDKEELLNFFNYCQKQSKIKAINITHPHKSCSELYQALHLDREQTGLTDCLIRSADRTQFVPLNLNGKSFVGWFLEEPSRTFNGMNIIIFGAGGAGKSIASEIHYQQSCTLTLVDRQDESVFASKINAEFLHELPLKKFTGNSGVILINATGGGDESIKNFLAIHRTQIDYLLDLRTDAYSPESLNFCMQHYPEIQAFSGDGMNLRNDYTLYSAICGVVESPPVSFTAWCRIVSEAL